MMQYKEVIFTNCRQAVMSCFALLGNIKDCFLALQ